MMCKVQWMINEIYAIECVCVLLDFAPEYKDKILQIRWNMVTKGQDAWPRNVSDHIVQIAGIPKHFDSSRAQWFKLQLRYDI